MVFPFSNGTFVSKEKHKKLKKELFKHKIIAFTNKEMREHYESLFNVSVKELKFEKMKNDFLLSLVDEVEELCKNKVNHNIIKEVIKNGKEREVLDRMIHNNLICK